MKLWTLFKLAIRRLNKILILFWLTGILYLSTKFLYSAIFYQEHQSQITTEEYNVFLKLLLNFFYDNINNENLPDFCDMMFSKGYLTMLPQVQIQR